MVDKTIKNEKKPRPPAGNPARRSRNENLKRRSLCIKLL